MVPITPCGGPLKVPTETASNTALIFGEQGHTGASFHIRLCAGDMLTLSQPQPEGK